MLHRICNNVSFGSKERWYNPTINTDPKEDDINLELEYFTDVHSVSKYLNSLAKESDKFDRITQDRPDIDAIKVTSGDMTVGYEGRGYGKGRKLMLGFLNNFIKPDAAAIGNHEFDSEDFKDELKKTNFPYVATNLELKNDEKFKNCEDKKIFHSYVLEKNGHKYGILGTVPTEIEKEFNPESDDETMQKSLEKEIDNLKENGINRIIILSHAGFGKDSKMAEALAKKGQSAIFIGGHNHKVIKNNVVRCYSNGHPVILTNAGRDGLGIGRLKVCYDSNGVIKSFQNHVVKSNAKDENKEVDVLKDKYLGKEEQIGVFKKGYTAKTEKDEHNAFIKLAADAVRYKSGAQLSFSRASVAIKNRYLPKGQFTNRYIQNLLSFNNRCYRAKISGKDILQIMKEKPWMEISGLFRKVVDGKLEMFVENPDGKLEKLDNSKKYTIAFDDYSLQGQKKKIDDSEESITYDWGISDATIDYIKSLKNKPIELRSRATTDFVKFKRSPFLLNQNNH